MSVPTCGRAFAPVNPCGRLSIGTRVRLSMTASSPARGYEGIRASVCRGFVSLWVPQRWREQEWVSVRMCSGLARGRGGGAGEGGESRGAKEPPPFPAHPLLQRPRRPTRGRSMGSREAMAREDGRGARGAERWRLFHALHPHPPTAPQDLEQLLRPVWLRDRHCPMAALPTQARTTRDPQAAI